jgi:KDO2-lipid IV(A) lauroyltransferase
VAEPAQAAPAARAARWDEVRPRLRRWRRYWIWDPLFGAMYVAFHYGARLLPIAWGSGFGAFLGEVSWRWRYGRDRARIEQLYQQLLPSAGPAEAARASHRLFTHLGRVMLEFSVLDRLWKAGRIEAVGAGHLHAARAAGKPVIVMGVHVGNWEVIGPTIIGLGLHGMKGFYQPPPSRFDHWILVQARKRYGAGPLHPGITATRVARRLLVEECGVFLIYGDEEHRGYISAPLFGRPILPRCNLVTAVKLAQASGAALIPAYAKRLRGARFRVTFLPPVELAPDRGDPSAGMADNVQMLDRIITPIILADLDNWYMLTEWRRHTPLEPRRR